MFTLNVYRKQITSKVDLDLLEHCADRYGVSLLNKFDPVEVKAREVIAANTDQHHIERCSLEVKQRQ